jgi:hypothetical protein
MIIRFSRENRRGVAMVWVLAILALLSALVGATTVRSIAGRRLLEQRHAQLQADWLARSGLEIAIAHLLKNPKEYEGEMVEPIPASRLQIKISRSDEQPDIYVVTCEATYPNNGRVPVTRRLVRSYERKADKEQTRMTVFNSVLGGN